MLELDGVSVQQSTKFLFMNIIVSSNLLQQATTSCLRTSFRTRRSCAAQQVQQQDREIEFIVQHERIKLDGVIISNLGERLETGPTDCFETAGEIFDGFSVRVHQND